MIKIFGTIGPACSEEAVIAEMFKEGMDGARLNLSHTTLEKASALIENFHAAAQSCGISPRLLVDMQGPESRIGILEKPVTLTEGMLAGPDVIPFPETVAGFLAGCDPGQEVLLDDGKILLKTERGEDGRMQLRVIRGGILQSRKSIAIPGCDLHAPAMTDRDRDQIARAREFGVTDVMQPFVRGRDDLIEVRKALDEAGCSDIRLLAKIENMEGVAKLDELIPHCDEIVIARGDLGNAMQLWELPAAQKRIAKACRESGRDFMVVTQMLESMTHRQVPSRAEVNDIFNAVIDGASSVMVTGETAAGEYPALVIRYLYRTAHEAEEYSRTMK